MTDRMNWRQPPAAYTIRWVLSTKGHKGEKNILSVDEKWGCVMQSNNMNKSKIFKYYTSILLQGRMKDDVEMSVMRPWRSCWEKAKNQLIKLVNKLYWVVKMWNEAQKKSIILYNFSPPHFSTFVLSVFYIKLDSFRTPRTLINPKSLQ